VEDYYWSKTSGETKKEQTNLYRFSNNGFNIAK